MYVSDVKMEAAIANFLTEVHLTVKKVGASLSNKLDSGVTHVAVFDTEEDDVKRMQDAHKGWVFIFGLFRIPIINCGYFFPSIHFVSFQWLVDSLEHKKRLPEEDYAKVFSAEEEPTPCEPSTSRENRALLNAHKRNVRMSTIFHELFIIFSFLVQAVDEDDIPLAHLKRKRKDGASDSAPQVRRIFLPAGFNKDEEAKLQVHVH